MHNAPERFENQNSPNHVQEFSHVNMSDPNETSAVFPRRTENNNQHGHHCDGNSLDFGNDIYGSKSNKTSSSDGGDTGRQGGGSDGAAGLYQQETQLLKAITELETCVIQLEQDLLAYETSMINGGNTGAASAPTDSTASATPSGGDSISGQTSAPISYGGDTNTTPVNYGGDATSGQTSAPAATGADNTAGQTSTSTTSGGDTTAGQGSTSASSGGDNTAGQTSTPASSSGDNTSGQTSTPTGDGSSTSSNPAAPIDSQTLTAIQNQNDRSKAAVWVEEDSQATNAYNAGGSPGAPSDAAGISGWGLIGNQLGATVDRSATVQVKNMETYVHLKGGGWELVENQNDPQSSLAGMTENTNYTNIQQANVTNTDGVGTIAAPPGALTQDHFGVNRNWIPGTFAPGSIDGVYERADIKANENNSGLVAKLGGEYWNDPGKSDNTIVGIPGTSNFIGLTDQYQTMYFTNLSPQEFANDLPPGAVTDQTVSTASTPVPESTTSGSTTSGSTTSGSSASGSSSSGGDSGAQSGSSGDLQKLIIPFPTDSEFAQINSDKSIPQGSLVFPVYSGDNSQLDNFDNIGPNVKANVIAAEQNGMVPIGYVGTNAGTKPLAEVESEIDKWYANAPVEGIYLGSSGQSNGHGYATDAASETYYEQIAAYIHSKGGKAVISGIAGGYGAVNPDYVNNFDVQTMGESYSNNLDQLNTLPASMNSIPSDKLAAFVSGVNANDMQSVDNTLKSKNAGYVWITDQDYGTSPEYLQQEINAIST